jgi:hypothetical protein
MFLSIVTRCCRRPKALTRNIESVLSQTSRDWEQLLFVDRAGIHDEDPILWANAQLERYKDCLRGEYIYILDDDRWFEVPDAISDIKRCAFFGPDVLLVKARETQLDNMDYVYPADDIWEVNWEAGKRPEKWSGCGACVIVKREIWQDHVHYYQHAPGGDWHFINSLIQAGRSFARLNLIVANSAGRGCGVLFEKCPPDWFEGIRDRYQPQHIRDEVWRLRAE